jgi:hypothetical protein
MGAQASSGGGPVYSQLRIPSCVSVSASVSGSVGRCHCEICDSSIWRSGLGRTVSCFRSPFFISHRSSQGRKCRRLTERLSSCSLVSLRMAGGISVSLLLRRLRTRSASSSKSSLVRHGSPLPDRKSRRNGCSELYTSSVIGASLIAGSFVRCWSG